MDWDKDLAAPSHHTKIEFNNPFNAVHRRNGKIIGTYRGRNGVTTIGKNTLWDTMFGNTSPLTQVNPWYIGLINNTPSPVLAAGDTMASHAGWAEWTGIAARLAWVDANAASGAKGTTTPSTFTMTAAGNLYGIFITSIATVSGTTGILWATGAFNAVIPVAISDTITVDYGVQA